MAVYFSSVSLPFLHPRKLIESLGLPLLWLAAPVSTFFWLVGSSSVLIIGHACLMEPGVESEYGGIEGV
jgi:hypothetical protein